MSVAVRRCGIAEIECNANFPALASEYAAEAAIHGLPPPDEKIASYRLIEASGYFQGYGAFLGDLLIGFIAVLTPIIPHYGIAVTVTESFFVGAAFRKTGAGLKLLRAAERHARDAGSPGLLISAPSTGRLARVLPRLGYRETNRVFFREIVHA
jgi:GNAT superfamily N-acetyltransferase